ncbi:MAG: MerR family transcriptional regulator [Sciscionella sp.]|nr:MerR family transcriptional regulator [Sciscionella sp.]
MTAIEHASDSSDAKPCTPLLSIGELSERTGVPTSALRYYDELGLVRPATRTAGRRRYATSAVREVSLIVAFREIGFSLAEIEHFITGERRTRQELIKRKLAELADQQHRIEVASSALEHGLKCPASDHLRCSRFWAIIEGRRRGLSVEESHARAHRHSRTDGSGDTPKTTV